MISPTPDVYQLGDVLFVPVSDGIVFAISRLSGKDYIVKEVPVGALKTEGPLDGPKGASSPVRNIILAVFMIRNAIDQKNLGAETKVSLLPHNLSFLGYMRHVMKLPKKNL